MQAGTGIAELIALEMSKQVRTNNWILIFYIFHLSVSCKYIAKLWAHHERLYFLFDADWSPNRRKPQEDLASWLKGNSKTAMLYLSLSNFLCINNKMSFLFFFSFFRGWLWAPGWNHFNILRSRGLTNMNLLKNSWTLLRCEFPPSSPLLAFLLHKNFLFFANLLCFVRQSSQRFWLDHREREEHSQRK